jgi:hypothetical protein
MLLASLEDEALDNFGVGHEKKRGEARASLKEQYDHWRPISGAFTLCNNYSLGMEAPPTTRNLLLVKSLRRLSACRRKAASSLLVAM